MKSCKFSNFIHLLIECLCDEGAKMVIVNLIRAFVEKDLICDCSEKAILANNVFLTII